MSGIHIKLAADHVVKELQALNKKAADVERYTVSDIKRRIPGIVSQGVASVYQIKKSDVSSLARFKRGVRQSRGRNEGKGKLRAFATGKTISTVAVVFKGSVHADWPTKPKRPKKSRQTVIRNGIRRSVPTAYQVTVETFRGNPAVIKPTKGHRVFVVEGRNRAFIVGADNKPLVKASTSIPQAIENAKSQARWMPELRKRLLERFGHHRRRLLGLEGP